MAWLQGIAELDIMFQMFYICRGRVRKTREMRTLILSVRT
jgi:hypothetical protein